ncbi:MAG: adenylyl-sulfate kinase, partial [Thalassobium sp.]
EVTLDTSSMSIDECVEIVLAHLANVGVLPEYSAA